MLIESSNHLFQNKLHHPFSVFDFSGVPKACLLIELSGIGIVLQMGQLDFLRSHELQIRDRLFYGLLSIPFSLILLSDHQPADLKAGFLLIPVDQEQNEPNRQLFIINEEREQIPEGIGLRQ